MSEPQSAPPNSDQENKLTSNQFDEFKEALEVLYVIANLSARIQFAQNWPAAADFVLGKDLMLYDRDGATTEEDKEDRADLEQEAEARRLALLEFMDTLEDKSVDKGALQVEYVKEAMGKLGRDLSLLVYGQQLVDRFLPPSPEELKQQEESAEQTDTTPADAESAAAGAVAAADVGETQVDEASASADIAADASQPPVTPDEESLSPDVGGAVSGDASGAPKIHVDPMDDVKPIDYEEQPTVNADPEPAEIVPETPPSVPPEAEVPPAVVEKPDVVAPVAPTLAEETADPLEQQQQMAENPQALTPEAPQEQAQQPAPPLTPEPPPQQPEEAAPVPASELPVTPIADDDLPPPAPEDMVKSVVDQSPPWGQPAAATPPPAPAAEPPTAPPQDATPPSAPPAEPLQTEAAAPSAPVSPPPADAPAQPPEGGLTQKPVGMKFVSSKDQQAKKPELPEGSQDDVPKDEGGQA